MTLTSTLATTSALDAVARVFVIVRRKPVVAKLSGFCWNDIPGIRSNFSFLVRDALRLLEAVVRGMEYFGSLTPRQRKRICRTVREQVKGLVGLCRDRYGSVDEPTGK